MSYYYCNVCGNVFNSKMINVDGTSYWYDCPISDCCGMVFELDEEMLIPIEMLNDKGYITEFCCSGHVYSTSPSGYIKFADEDYMPDTVPKGWYKDPHSSTTIRYDITKGGEFKPSIQKRNTIVKHIDSLIKWCEGLEDISC